MASTTSLKLDDRTKQRLQRLAEARHRSAHWLMRQAIEQFVEREESRETAWAEARQAWEDYQATGRHVTQAEADAWLERIAAGEDAEPPACHD